MRLQPHNAVNLFSGINGDVQIAVGAASGTIPADAQGSGVDLNGPVGQNHGTVRLSYSTARELWDFLDHLDGPADRASHRPLSVALSQSSCVTGLISRALLEAWKVDIDRISIPHALALSTDRQPVSLSAVKITVDTSYAPPV